MQRQVPVHSIASTKDRDFTFERCNCHTIKSMLHKMALTIESTIQLPSGSQLPRLGLGVYQARSSECVAAVKCAIETGYKHSALLHGWDDVYHSLVLTR